MKHTEAKVGQRVAYVPTHAAGDLKHTDVEIGEITKINDEYIFVCFDADGKNTGSKSCYPANLIRIG